MWRRRLLPKHHRSSGLTLIEVMVAMGVMVILLGGIFLIVQTSLKTVLMIDDYASREDEMTNLVDILRFGFRNLPPTSRMSAEPTQIDGEAGYLLAFRDAPGFLSWQARPEADTTIVLLAAKHDDENNGWRVCLKRFTPSERFDVNEFGPGALLKAAAGVPWLELVGDFRKIGFRFQAARSSTWETDWKTPKARPALIEMTLISDHAKDPNSERSIIWVPPVQLEVAS